MYASSAFDRCGPRRRDEAWVDQLWNAPETRVLVFAGTRFAAVGGQVWWGSSPDVTDATGTEPGTRVLLGIGAQGPRFAVLGPRDLDPPPSGIWVGLREAFGFLGGVNPGNPGNPGNPDNAGELALVVHAVGLAEWHTSHQYCPRCGGALQPREAGNVLRCADCGRDQFPRTDAAVIMLITDEEDRALLGRQPSWPQGRWSTLAGFVEPGETLEDAVRREVFEEVGVLVGEVTYAGSQPWPLPASLMLGFTGKAVSTDIEVDGEEIQAARWFSREDALAGAEDGSLVIPPGISISRSLITSWYGSDLPGSWT